jgi:hypothetical protein
LKIYKSTKCNDVSVTIYCPRGPFCAFAHIERLYSKRILFKKKQVSFSFIEELKSYRDFDLHYTNELPLSSFIPIPEDKEVDVRYQTLFFSFLISYFRHYHQNETFQKNLPNLHYSK